MKRRLYVVSTATLAFALITINFSNCSKVAFDAALQENGNADALGKAVGSIVIEGGNPYTRNREVVATLHHASAQEMYITDVPNCSNGGDWEAYAPFKRWTLASTNQEVRLYAKFRELAGSAVESDCYEDAIIHDDVPPLIVAPLNIPSFTRETAVNMNFAVTDTLSGVDRVQCKKDSGNFEACSAQMALSALTEGAHSAQIIATDKAGNSSAPTLVSFTVDLTPPVVQFNQTPAAITADTNSVFAFSGQDALSGVASYECRSSDAAAWVGCTSPVTQVYASGAQKFSVRATDRVGNVSQPVAYSFVIDTSVPSVRITRSPLGYTNVAVAQLEFSGVPGAGTIVRFQCSLDNAAYADCTSPLSTAALAEGPHSFRVIGYNAAGTASSPAMASWVVDLTPPIARIDAGPAALTNETRGDLAFSATDAISGVREIQCQLNNSGFQACTSVRSYTGLVEGNYTFQVRAIDNAGNTSSVVSHTWRVDNTKPTVTIVSGPAAQVKEIDATLVFTATDGAGQIARIECRLDAAVDWETCTSPKQYTGLNQGSHSFQVRAIDTAGNISDVKTHAWFADSIGPAINFGQQPLSVLPSNSNATFQFTVVDAGVGVASISCGMNGQMAACTADTTRQYQNLAVGNYSFRVDAVDLLGNASTRTIAFKVEQRTMAYQQVIPVTSNNKADIIVVIDNSGSMSQEQASMASRFGTFLDQLNGLDWQVGIVTTDMSANAVRKDGRLIEMVGYAGQYKITSGMDINLAKQYFANTIQRPASEGSANEQGIAATYRAVLRNAEAASASNPNNGFLRQGAVLSVVVVTDADETNPNGTQTQNRPENLVNLVKNTYPGKAFGFHSIIVRPQDVNCLNLAGSGNEGYGYAYASASQLTNGVIGTVCSENYGTQLAQMGRAVVDSIASANLNCAPIDTTGDGVADVQIVTADGSAAPTYTINNLVINFSRPLPVGNNQLRYSCIAQ